MATEVLRCCMRAGRQGGAPDPEHRADAEQALPGAPAPPVPGGDAARGALARAGALPILPRYL